ncbi:MAG: transposase [Candidatus Zixiibacteriota bacterium]
MWDPFRVRQRRSIRLQAYDYAQEGAYFVTVCTACRAPALGTVSHDDVILSLPGKIAASEWVRTADIRPNVELDEFIIMPDHLHGIVVITENRARQCKTGFQSPSQSLGAIIRGWKGIVTGKVRRALSQPNLVLWQRGFWEHIIRNEADLDAIRYYIKYNALKKSLERSFPPDQMTHRL